MPRARTEQEALDYIQPLIPFLETGLGVNHSCNMAKISKASLYKHMEKFPSVKTEIDTARSRAIATAVGTLNRAAGKDWRAALEVAKRRDRQDWGDNVDITTKGKKITPLLGGGSVSEGDSDREATQAS